MHSFYLEPEAWPAEAGFDAPWLLAGNEAHHLLKVVRLKEGEQARLFDGQGREGIFRLTRRTSSQAWLTPERLTRHPAPAAQTWLALGWTKALRRGWLLEKAVELEASGVWFWQAERSQGKIPDEVKGSWHGQCVAGAKQSGNPWLPELRSLAGGLAEVFRAAQGFDHVFALWEDQEHERMLSEAEAGRPGKTLFILGPEGGFSPAEVALFLSPAARGAAPVTLGRRVLRWETAALLCLGLAWRARQAHATGEPDVRVPTPGR